MTTPETTRAELDREIQDNLVAMGRISRLANPTPYDERSFDEMSEHVERLVERRNRQGVEDSPRAVDIRELIRSGQTRSERGARFGNDTSGARMNRDDGQDLVVRGDESLAQWGQRTGHAPGWTEGTDDRPRLHFGRILRGLARGDWEGSDAEMRAMSESPVTAGGHLVPAPLAANLIDRARDSAVLTQLGATVVPMTSATLKVPRIATGLTGANAPDWRNENQSINDKAITLDAVTLTARSLACMVKCSWELLDDAPGVEDVVRREFSNQFAAEFDRVGLYGTGAAPQPQGIKGTSGVTISGGTGNGAALTSWDWLIDMIVSIRSAGWEPTGAILPPKVEGSLGKLRETGTTGPYLQIPPAVATFPRKTTRQVRSDLTQGTSSGIVSDVFVGAWSTVMIGARIPLRIRVLEERFADTGQVAFLADLRGDIAVAQPSAMLVLTGVL